ncbi:unnamed protein product [Caenorhabditis nigoni]
MLHSRCLFRLLLADIYDVAIFETAHRSFVFNDLSSDFSNFGVSLKVQNIERCGRQLLLSARLILKFQYILKKTHVGALRSEAESAPQVSSATKRYETGEVMGHTIANALPNEFQLIFF